MLLPFVFDVVSSINVIDWWLVVMLPLLRFVWLILLPCGDVVTTCCVLFGWCYCQCSGCCYCHLFGIWQMLCHYYCTRAQETLTIKTCTRWFHIIKASARESKKHAANMGYRYISKEDKKAKASLWLPRTMVLLPAKVESYTDINAMNKGVVKNT